MRRAVLHALAALALATLTAGCSGAASPAVSAASAAALRDRGPRVEDAFDGPPDLLVVVRPRKLARDPLYGPLLRRASELASVHAALAAKVGSTAFAVIERADEVILGVYDPAGRDAVVAIRGVPPDASPTRVVDTDGTPLWSHVRDLANGVTELAPADGTDASLFVLPGRAWVITVGAASTRARTTFIEGASHTATRDAGIGAVDADPDPLVVARFRGDALVKSYPRLLDGPLAPLARGLAYATASVAPGPEGQVGEVTLRFVYDDDAAASDAEELTTAVVAAFTRRFEAKAPWLHAVTVTREERAVLARGRIPRAWADGFIHLDLPAAL